MPKAFNGQVHVRVSPDLHEDVAREAFDTGVSISGIFAQALIVRRALRSIDPWKSVEEVQSANRAVPAEEVERIVSKAVKSVRKNRRAQ
jgi:HicB family